MKYQITEAENEPDFGSMDDLNWAKVPEGSELRYEKLQAELSDVTSTASSSARSSTPELSSRSVSSVSSTNMNRSHSRLTLTQTQTGHMRDVYDDLVSNVRGPYIPSKDVVASKNSRCSTVMSASRDKNPQGSEHARFIKRPFSSTSSTTSATPSLEYGRKISQDASAKLHRTQRRNAILPEMLFRHTKSRESHTFHYPWSGLLVYFSDACIHIWSGFIFCLRPHNYMSWFAIFIIWTGFLICAERYFRTSVNNLSSCLLAGSLFSKTLCKLSQTLGYGPPWFEEPSLGSELAQLNYKLINIADISVLEAIPSSLLLAQQEISRLKMEIEKFSVVPSTKVLLHLSDYLLLSPLIRMCLQDFNSALEVMLLRAFSLTQSTIGGLRHIAEIEAHQTYFAWTGTYLLGLVSGENAYLSNSSGCSTSLSAALFAEHIDQVVPHIYPQEEYAGILVTTFNRLRRHLTNVVEVRKQHQFPTMKQFYERNDVEVEKNFWAKIRIFFEGEQSIPVLNISKLEIDSLQLILTFTVMAEEYFDQILSKLVELEAQLTDLEIRARSRRTWTFKCGFKKAPIRLWIKELQRSINLRAPVQESSPDRRQIAMSPEVEVEG